MIIERNKLTRLNKLTWNKLKLVRRLSQKFKETGDSSYICQNELGKACFQHDIAYGDFEDLPRRTASDKILRDKSFNIAKNPKYDGYQHELASMVYKFFDRKYSGSAVTHADNSAIKSKIMTNQQLAEDLHKPLIRKLEKPKVYSSFKDNIWGVDLGDI